MTDAMPPDPFPGHDGGAWSPVPGRVVASWPAGHFAENLAVDSAGQVFVSLHSHNRAERYDPATGTVATLPAARRLGLEVGHRPQPAAACARARGRLGGRA